MSEFRVYFHKFTSIVVEAKDEDEAVEIAEKDVDLTVDNITWEYDGSVEKES